MVSDKWNVIEENYNKALRYLVPPDESSVKIKSDSRVTEWWDVNTRSYWQKDELHGLQYLLLAYNEAVKQEEKNHLLFARILMLMYRDYRGVGEYEQLKLFLAPAIGEYELAVKEDGKLHIEKEIEFARGVHDYVKNGVDHRKNSQEVYNEALKLIDGWNDSLAEKLWFHDAYIEDFHIVKNGHDNASADMVLRQEDNKFLLHFDNVVDLKSDVDLWQNYIFDMHCYRQGDYLCFDVELFTILCDKVSVKELAE